ncbi:MAG: 2-dehydropantoate 2-reductase [Deltaproteobacteria bacterium]|nr:2-dehydropantoate 2-reductase [Deltaproteobacteria bacterium]
MALARATSTTEGTGPRVLVVGLGGIGGTIAAHLLARGLDVYPVTSNAQIRDVILRDGYRLEGVDASGRPAAARVVRGPIYDDIAEAHGPFEYVFLAVQPPQVEEAARRYASLLAPGGAMVCLQNGLCEWRIASIVGRTRVLGAVVSWGASMDSPGIYQRTSGGGFTIGGLDAHPDARCVVLADMLACIGPTAVTDNLVGVRWTKLAMNCAVSSLGTIGGDRLGRLMRHRFVRRLALEVMTEAVAVAAADGIRLEKIAGTIDLQALALTEVERTARGRFSLLRKHLLLMAVGLRYRRLRSSMLRALERGRPPAVDFLNGEVVARARAIGRSCPVNEEICSIVHVLAAGRAHQVRPGLHQLRTLYARSRAADRSGRGGEVPALSARDA